MYGKIKPLVARVNWPAVGICTGHFERFKVDQIHSNVIFYLYFYSSNMVTLNHFTQCFFFLENCSHWRIKNKMHLICITVISLLYLFIFHSIFSSVIVDKLIFFFHFKRGYHAQYFQRTCGSFSNNAGLC